MSNYIETEDQLNPVARRSIAAAEVAVGPGRNVAQLRAFLVRRRTFLGMIVAFLLVIIAEPVPAMLYAGAAMMATAHVLRLICSGYLDKDVELATAGPFGWCRNPLYIANFLVVISFALMSGRAIALPVMLVLWLATHAPTVAFEEEILREKFGGRFEDYCRRVPRWLPKPNGCCGEGQFRWRRIIENGEHLNIISAWLVAAMFFVEMVR